jgi:subtilisin-like proprotein convertase family protein
VNLTFARRVVRSRPSCAAGRFRAEPLERRLLLATVSGLKFNDLDGDGLGEVGEPGLQGWTIFHDTNNDGTLDLREESDVTDANGNYSLTFPAGTVGATPEVIREIPRAGWRPTTPAGGAITLTLFDTSTRTLNFGNTQRGLVTGTKFNDMDGDGARDLADPGLANFTIFADLDGDTVLDAGEPRDVTDASGNYALNLPTSATVYRIREVDQVGWRQTLPGPQQAPGGYTVLLDQPGEVVEGRNFGNTQRVLLSGQKIEDLDGDGVRDAGEPGLAGWRIYIDTDNNGFDAGDPSDVTDSDGRWSLSPTGGGPFVVKEVHQTGYRQTAPQTAANGEAYRVVFVAPAEGKSALGLDFLNTRRPLVSGIKFNDQDADGVRDVGEPGLAGFTIYHDADNDLTLDAGEDSTVTDADGGYVLSLPPGTADLARLYRIREVDQLQWRQTFPVNNGANLVSLLPGETIANRNFGNTRRALVTGNKFEDSDGDGTRDAAEPGVGNVRIFSDDNNNGIFDAGEESTLTDANGDYSLDVSAPLIGIPGRPSVIIREVIPGGWIPINPVDGAHELNVLAGGTATGRNFANARYATIGGRKFHDLDADGSDDATEPGLAGWRIYVDSNDNGVYDADTDTVAASSGLPLDTRQGDTVYSRVTASGLHPLITDVNVRVDITHANVSDLSVFLISPRGTRVLLFNNVGGSSNNIDRVLLDDEATNTFTTATVPYANETIRPEGNLGQFDNEDPNGQWRLEVTDAGGANVGTLDAWELILSTAEPSDLTAAPNGVYGIGFLRPGTHVVREVRQAGWFQTAPAGGSHTAITRSGLINANVDFGNAQPGSVSGRKWNDRDGDGVIDAGEVGLAGWVIYRDLDNDGELDTFNRRFERTVNADIRDAIDAPGPGTGVIPGITQFLMPVSAPIGLIIDLNVAVNITHPRIADLTLLLTSPSGETINLTGDLTAAGANMNTTFDDSAPNAIGSGTPPYTGVFRPSQPLSTFVDDDPDGVWRLTIIDSALGPAGTARLNDWALDVTFGDPRRVTDVSGAYSFDGLRPGVEHVIREVGQPGWGQTFPTGDGAQRVTLGSNQDVTGRNFGNREGLSVSAVYARGSSWLGDDGNATNVTFKEYLAATGLGDVVFGYRIQQINSPPLPWVNVNQLVVVYDGPLPTTPLPASVVVHGVRSDYTAVPSVLAPNAVLLTLDRPLGTLPAGGENGDWIVLTDDGVTNRMRFIFSVLQGDVLHAGETGHQVVANDASDIKPRFFSSTNNPGAAGPRQYTVFHDLDASGSIVANDFSLAKARFFDNLPPPPPVMAGFSDKRLADDVLA